MDEFSEEIHLSDLGDAAKRRWLSTTTILVSCVALAAFVGIWLPSTYRAEIGLAPAANASAQVSPFGGSISAVAAQFGLPTQGSAGDLFPIALATLESEYFLGTFAKSRELSVPLLGSKGWSEERESWVLDDQRVDSQTGAWIWKRSSGYVGPPTIIELAEALQKRLRISVDRQTRLVSVTLTTEAPEASVQWLEWLIRDLNEELRNREIAESRNAIGALSDQLADTNIAEVRQILFELVGQHSNRLTLARARTDFAFQVINPPLRLITPTGPPRLLIVLVGLVIGILLAGAIVLASVKPSKRP